MCRCDSGTGGGGSMAVKTGNIAAAAAVVFQIDALQLA
jgi:hypothetical protein